MATLHTDDVHSEDLSRRQADLTVLDVCRQAARKAHFQ